MPDDPRTTLSPLEAQLAQAVELNKVLYEALAHYADEAHWDCIYQYGQETTELAYEDWYTGGIHGYTVAQDALVRYQTIMDGEVSV